MNIEAFTSEERWSVNDERDFQRMATRRERVQAKRRAAVERIVREMDSPIVLGSDAGVDWLIQNAEQLRDALEPYDSGVRCSPDQNFKAIADDIARSAGYGGAAQ